MKPFTVLKRRAAAAGLVVGVLSTLLAALPASAATREIVTPSTTTWVAGSLAAGTGSYVSGPGGPALGVGSYRQQTPSSADRQTLGTNAFNGISLSSINTFAYSTYVTSNTDGQAAAINLKIDKNNDGTTDATLTFEPAYQNGAYTGSTVPNQCPGIAKCVKTGAWQRWNARSGGWWESAGGPPLITIDDYLVANPGAKLATDRNALFMAAGNGWTNYDGNFDALTVNSNTYDFEPVAASTVVVHPNVAPPAVWEIHNNTSTGADSGETPTAAGTKGTFVQGPGTPASGTGSFQQVVKATEKQYLMTRAYSGASLENFDVSYATYRPDLLGGSHVSSLNLLLDTNTDSIADVTLVFEPVQQQGFNGAPAVAAGVWQTWDAGQGKWWTNKIATGPGSQSSPQTIEWFVANKYPTAKLATADQGSLRISAGSSASWPDYTGYVDAVKVRNVNYDFETFATPVDCDGATDDIAAVQAAVDGAANGDVIKLKGTCDFKAATADNGTVTSVTNAAILVRPSNPLTSLTITSDGANQSSTIAGSGTQTAFAVAPGNNNVTIKNLKFTNLRRALVAINSDGTTFGSAAGLPASDGNRIIGGASMGSAILGLAVRQNPAASAPGNVVIGYGATGASATFSGQDTAKLTNFKALGNFITFNPPGVPDGSNNDIVGIDVRQRYFSVVDGVDIRRNVVGMFASDFPSFNYNGIKVHSTSPNNDVAGPFGPNDYYIRNVTIDSNNLGRLEDLGTYGGLNPGDVNAAGRAGVVVIGASNFSIRGNGVRSRLSPTGAPMPGGGIVVSDSGFGSIGQNGIIVLADPSTESSDLGAIGVINNVNQLFAGAAAPQPTKNVLVDDNTIGVASQNTPGIGSQRGLVLNGADNVTAKGNNFKFTSSKALNIGSAISGPGSLTAPGTVTLTNPVTHAVACDNTLDGVNDDVTEVATTAGATANALPGGTGSNVGCGITLTLSANTLNSSTPLTALGVTWPGRSVTVEVANGPSTINKVVSAADSGAYSATFTAGELGTVPDGVLSVKATVVDGLLPSFNKVITKSATKDTVAPAGLTIASASDPVNTGNKTAVGASGTTESGSTVSVVVADAGAVHATAPKSATVTGTNWTVAGINLSTLTDGAITYTATATDASGNTSTATLSAIKDTGAPAIAVTTVTNPINDANKLAVAVAGTADAGSPISVVLTKGAVSTTTATTTADPSGNWSVSGINASALADGVVTVVATTQDLSSNSSASSATTTKDTVTNVVLNALGAFINASRAPSVGASGTGEPGSAVTVTATDGTLSVVAPVQTVAANGTWSTVLDTTGLSDGNLNFTANSVDVAGNAASASRLSLKDVVAPAVAISSVSDPITAVNEAGVTANGIGEPGAAIAVVVTDGTRSASTATQVNPSGDWSISGLNATSLINGTVTYSATAADPAGNSAVVTRTADKLADAHAPKMKVVANPYGYVGQTDTADGKVAVKVVQPGPNASSVVAVTVSDGTTTVSAGSQTLSLGEEGTFLADVSSLVDGVITAVATSGTSSMQTTAVLDRGAPAATIADAAMVYIAKPLLNNLDFKGTAADSISNVESVVVTIKGPSNFRYSTFASRSAYGQSTNWTANFRNLTLPTNGQYTVTAKSIDSAGNVSSEVTTASFTTL